MTAFLSRESILTEDDIQPAPVRVPEWGDEPAYVAVLTADQRDAMEELWRELRADDDSQVGFRAFVVAYCLCDPKGKRFFDDPKEVAFGAAKLGNKRKASGVTRVFNAACRLNGLLKEDVEALEKNSENPPSESGSSA